MSPFNGQFPHGGSFLCAESQIHIGMCLLGYRIVDNVVTASA